MDKFIKPVDLLSELCSIVATAEKEIYIVCPFPELHHHFKRALRDKLENKEILITFLFGKFSNKDHYNLQEEDLTFLKSFPNIRIIYHERLHAKFYANEKIALVTTLNLNHTSSNYNIEYGIKFEGESHPVSIEIKTFIKKIVDEGTSIFQNSISSHLEKFHTQTDYAGRISKIKADHPNAYEIWKKTDDEKLEFLYCEGKKIKELSEIFKRQPSAIRARVNKLELSEKYDI
jgi:hypothetical protein